MRTLILTTPPNTTSPKEGGNPDRGGFLETELGLSEVESERPALRALLLGPVTFGRSPAAAAAVVVVVVVVVVVCRSQCPTSALLHLPHPSAP